jgi:isopenicillin-N epimerase
VHARGQDIVLVPNATTAVATVLDNLSRSWQAGDEIIATAHEYPACMNNLRRIAARVGAKIVSISIPFPLRDPAQVEQPVLGAVTPRTRAALLSSATSPSALILPVERIVPELERRGIAAIVDGAHGIGFAPLDLQALGASFYTSNCHKWLCAPKGSAFLHIREDRQEDFRPLILSNNAERPRPGRKHLLTEFDFVGTHDPTPYLVIPKAIEFLGGLLPGGWPELMAKNHAMVLQARDLVCRRLNIEPPAPDSMLGAMATLFLPAHDPERHAHLMSRPTRYHDALQDALLDRWKIQVPVWAIPGETRRLFRISAQLYNSWEQYEYLAEALAEEVERERRF